MRKTISFTLPIRMRMFTADAKKHLAFYDCDDEMCD